MITFYYLLFSCFPSRSRQELVGHADDISIHRGYKNDLEKKIIILYRLSRIKTSDISFESKL